MTIPVNDTQALTLLDHLVKNGTERVVENARDHMFKLRQLSDFSYHDGSADKGAGGTPTSPKFLVKEMFRFD